MEGQPVRIRMRRVDHAGWWLRLGLSFILACLALASGVSEKSALVTLTRSSIAPPVEASVALDTPTPTTTATQEVVPSLTNGPTKTPTARAISVTVSAPPTPSPVPLVTGTVLTPTSVPLRTYTVVAGDTLFAIARRFDTSVEALKATNGLTSDLIRVGQVLRLPLVSVDPSPVQAVATQARWRPAPLVGTAYTASLERERFTLHFDPAVPPARPPTALAGQISRALAHLESLLAVSLAGRFDVYVAGTLFAPPNQALRGHSFSADRHLFFLDDGTGNPADQTYIVTHELTHLFTWNTFGKPSSAMLSEGVAVYAGLEAIQRSDHLPLGHFCLAYRRANRLPRLSTWLPYGGHIRHLENYYAAGCLVKYLIETYGVAKFAALYPSSSYSAIYGKNLASLEGEWLVYLDSLAIELPFLPGEFVQAIDELKVQYEVLFADFAGTPEDIARYRALDAMRLALMQGQLGQVNRGHTTEGE